MRDISMVLLSLVVSSTTALDVFHTNCTLPESTARFVTAPNARGTLEILWSSLATIIACVYTVLHLNVPEQRRGRDPGLWGDFCWTVRRGANSLSYALITMILPESTLFKAIVDWTVARRYLRKLNTIGGISPTWTLQHMLFTGMGGFAATYQPTDTPGQHADGADLQQSSIIPSLHDQATMPVWHFTCETLVEGIRRGLLPKTPPITAEDIADKSRADVVGRAVALTQICYFVAGVIARAASHLPISQLELGACAFVPYAVGIYAFSFLKPKAPLSAVVLKHCDTSRPLRKLTRADAGDTSSTVLWNLPSMRRWKPGDAVPDALYHDRHLGRFKLLGLFYALLTVPFGAVHIAAWHFTFPTDVELLIWRIAAMVVTVGLPIGFLLAEATCNRIDNESIALVIETCLWGSLSIMFVVARCFIIVELFRTLAFLPSGSYITTWAINIPHIG